MFLMVFLAALSILVIDGFSFVVKSIPLSDVKGLFLSIQNKVFSWALREWEVIIQEVTSSQEPKIV